MTGVSPAETKNHAQAHHAGHPHDHKSCDCGHDHGSAKEFDTSALISARGLTMMRGDRVVLDHVDVDIHPREIVTLIGPNGSGKTTLVRALLGLQDMTGGEVSRMEDLRIGYVPQRFDIDRTLPMTVSRFLSLGHKSPP